MSFFKNKITEKITTTEKKTAINIKPNELEHFPIIWGSIIIGIYALIYSFEYAIYNEIKLSIKVT